MLSIQRAIATLLFTGAFLVVVAAAPVAFDKPPRNSDEAGLEQQQIAAPRGRGVIGPALRRWKGVNTM